MIYFIRSEGFVKIGHTTNRVKWRLKELQTGNPAKLELLGFVKGNRHDEYRLHELFGRLRHRGEWFRLDPELEDYIKAVSGRPDLYIKESLASRNPILQKLISQSEYGLFRFKSATKADRLRVAYDIENTWLRLRYSQ